MVLNDRFRITFKEQGESAFVIADKGQLNQETGEVLWEINLGSPVTGFPISFEVDGKQYIAASVGTAGTATMFAAMTPELRPSFGNNLFVFALPE